MEIPSMVWDRCKSELW